MRITVRAPLAALKTLLIAPIFVIGTLFLAAMIVVIAPFKQDARIIDSIILLWSKFFVGLGPGTVIASGKEKLDADTQYLFVANHESNLDVPVMYLTVDHAIRYLAKSQLYSIPFFSQAMKAVGMVRTDRTAGKESHGAINQGIAEARARGHSLIIFPEGTRSATGELLPFKKGAFRIAIANQLPIVPVSINGTWEMWAPGKKIVYPGTIITKVHDPIPTSGLELTDIESLSERCRAIIAGDLT